MDEERRTWVWGPIDATGLSQPVDAVTGEPLPGPIYASDHALYPAPTHPKPVKIFRLGNQGRLMLHTEDELIFRFQESGVRTEVAFTLEEMQALQRVARAQIELEKRRGREG